MSGSVEGTLVVTVLFLELCEQQRTTADLLLRLHWTKAGCFRGGPPLQNLPAVALYTAYKGRKYPQQYGSHSMTSVRVFEASMHLAELICAGTTHAACHRPAHKYHECNTQTPMGMSKNIRL